MVTQDGYSPVGPVVGQDLGRNVVLPYRRVACLRTSHQKQKTLSNEQIRVVPLVSSFNCCCRVIEAL